MPDQAGHDKERRAGAKPRNPSFALCIRTYIGLRMPAVPPHIPEWSFPNRNRIDNAPCDRTRPYRTIEKTTGKTNNKKRKTKGLTESATIRTIIPIFTSVLYCPAFLQQ